MCDLQRDRTEFNNLAHPNNPDKNPENAAEMLQKLLNKMEELGIDAKPGG